MGNRVLPTSVLDLGYCFTWDCISDLVGVEERILVLAKIFSRIFCAGSGLAKHRELGAGVFDGVVPRVWLSELCRVGKTRRVCQDTESCDYWESEIRRYNTPLTQLG